MSQLVESTATLTTISSSGTLDAGLESRGRRKRRHSSHPRSRSRSPSRGHTRLSAARYRHRVRRARSRSPSRQSQLRSQSQSQSRTSSASAKGCHPPHAQSAKNVRDGVIRSGDTNPLRSRGSSVAMSSCSSSGGFSPPRDAHRSRSRTPRSPRSKARRRSEGVFAARADETRRGRPSVRSRERSYTPNDVLGAGYELRHNFNAEDGCEDHPVGPLHGRKRSPEPSRRRNGERRRRSLPNIYKMDVDGVTGIAAGEAA